MYCDGIFEGRAAIASLAGAAQLRATLSTTTGGIYAFILKKHHHSNHTCNAGSLILDTLAVSLITMSEANEVVYSSVENVHTVQDLCRAQTRQYRSYFLYI